jgi:acetyl esterase/lipase
MKFTVLKGLLCFTLLLSTGCAQKGAARDAAPIAQTSTPNAARNEVINGQGSESTMENSMHMKTSSTIRAVVNHPAFEGFGQFILPLDRGRYDMDMPLENIALLLPYHSNVDPVAAVNTINYMIDEVNSGETIFYDFYTDEEKQLDPTKESTGLFFFRGKPGAPFALSSAGGGFSYVGSIHEGFPLAIQLAQQGYNAFVIQYRIGGAKVACADLAAAISFVFANAGNLEVGKENYSLWGGSAGARMAASLGSYGPAAFGRDGLARPAAVVMQYTGHSAYTKDDLPTFAIVGENDGIASPTTMARRVNALKAAGIDAEFHKYPNLSHGFGLGIGTSAEGWLDDAVAFWEKHMHES